MKQFYKSNVIFKAKFSADVKSGSVVGDGCGRHLNGSESGTITSPGYPNVTKYPYKTAMNCDSWISVLKGKVVELKFTDFDLPEYRWGDFVMVRSIKLNVYNLLSILMSETKSGFSLHVI